jgi:hypothetical protein
MPGSLIKHNVGSTNYWAVWPLMRLPEAIAIFPRLISRPSFVSIALAAALGSGVIPTHAGPWTDQIAQLQKITRSKTPTLPQKLSAQLHQEPTPNDVGEAENKAKARAAAALARAQEADAKNDAAACTELSRN